jgi:hypothetical protein
VAATAEVVPLVLLTQPTEVEVVVSPLESAEPVVDATIAIAIELSATTAALATGTDTTENNPAVSADTATTAMRCFIVFVDMFFLSLVEFEHFPISARRPC